MADVGTQAALQMFRGEDFVAQFYFSGEDDDAIPLTEPVRMQVKDGSGQLVLDFRSDTDQETEEHIEFIGDAGFIQISCPRVVINRLQVGRYLFDLYAQVNDGNSPWAGGMQTKVLDGYVDVGGRITDIDSPETEPSSTFIVDGGTG